MSPRAEGNKEKNSSVVSNNDGPGAPLLTSWNPAKNTKDSKYTAARQLLDASLGLRNAEEEKVN